MRPAFSRIPVPSWKTFCLTASLLLPAATARAQEDPLLGQIKALKCVGCTAGAVDLVIHDPIDVRDFEVRIKEDDYQKIITPLPGKTVYDKNGCFYWFDAPKDEGTATKKDADKRAKAPAKQPPAADSSPANTDSDSPAPPPAPQVQGTPSRCIPFTRIEAAPSRTGKKQD